MYIMCMHACSLCTCIRVCVSIYMYASACIICNRTDGLALQCFSFATVFTVITLVCS